ncbi:ArsR/SmtB family transcription factor [Methyloterricola oryzae]|uniref:ArsR/SmtB family transcription factor n=1 Tax=Methyloterricola oryzae TaxID=1495050 RepID=UPI0005EBD8CC|nr:metalloregulator ArsR/SmtB family transcription factor [Methyloterricola oryzae]
METRTAVRSLTALAQETRLAIFRLLVQAGPEGLAAGKISESLGLVPSSLSFHLKELARADLVSVRQEGRFLYYAADFQAMNALLAYLTENCCGGQPCEASAVSTCCPDEEVLT